MRGDTRSPIWGGATLGLVVGLILGFFVGSSYWMTVLYAVLVGAALGVLANVLAVIGNIVSKRRGNREPPLTQDDRRLTFLIAEENLREDDPADFNTNDMRAALCVDSVRNAEEEEAWRLGYDTLESFYREHEERHPDIRFYALVSRELWNADLMTDASGTRAGIGAVIVQRIAAHRASTEPAAC